MAKKIRRSAPPTQAASAPQGAPASKPRGRGGRVSSQAVTDFTIQLSTLSEAGIPVVKALSILEGQTRPGPFKNVLAEITEDVAAGTPLSEAMAKHERCFDSLYANMVRAGEAGGVLDQVLQRLAAFREKAATIRATVRGAMIYPTVIMVVAVGVIATVMIVVIPNFEEIFKTFKIDLPRVTQILLDVSRATLRFWYLVFGLPVLIFFLHGLGMRRSDGYRYRMHRLLLKLPGLGGVLTTSLIAGFARTFGTLVQAGVPHLDALTIVRDTSWNDVLKESVEDIRRTVREGEGLARPMGESGVFDDLVVNMVDVGEATGELDRMLLRVADAYEVQVDRRIDAFFKVLEPALLIFIAAIVGFIVIALFMPLLEIMGQLSGSL